MVFLSVCQSVCVTNACFVTKQIIVCQIYQHRTTERFFYFLRAKLGGSEFRGSSPNDCVKDRYPLSKAQI